MQQRVIASFAAALLDLSARLDASLQLPQNSIERLIQEAVRELALLLPREKTSTENGGASLPPRDHLIAEFESVFATHPGLDAQAATTLIRVLGSSLPVANSSELNDTIRTAVILRTSDGAIEPSERGARSDRELVVRKGGVDYPLDIAEIAEVVVIPPSEPTVAEKGKKSVRTPYAGPRRTDTP